MTPDAPLIYADAAQRDSLVDALRRGLEAEPDVIFAYVHGSILTPLPFRDLDVAVYLDAEDPRRIRERTLTLIEALEAAVTATARPETSPHVDALTPPVDVLVPPVDVLAPPVDVLALNHAPLGFRYQVLHRGRLVLSRDEAFRVRWAVRTMSRYLDLKPLRDLALKEAMTA